MDLLIHERREPFFKPSNEGLENCLSNMGDVMGKILANPVRGLIRAIIRLLKMGRIGLRPGVFNKETVYVVNY